MIKKWLQEYMARDDVKTGQKLKTLRGGAAEEI